VPWHNGQSKSALTTGYINDSLAVALNTGADHSHPKYHVTPRSNPTS